METSRSISPTEFAELYREHYRYVTRICGRFDSANAEDLAQETFLRAWEFRKQFRRQAKFSTWLTRIAVNVALAKLRKLNPVRAAMSLDELREDHDHAEKLEPAGMDRGQANIENRQVLERAMEGISPTLRMTVVLHFGEGMELKEIARQLDVPVSTVKMRSHRGQQLLKEKLVRLGA